MQLPVAIHFYGKISLGKTHMASLLKRYLEPRSFKVHMLDPGSLIRDHRTTPERISKFLNSAENQLLEKYFWAARNGNVNDDQFVELMNLCMRFDLGYPSDLSDEEFLARPIPPQATPVDFAPDVMLTAGCIRNQFQAQKFLDLLSEYPVHAKTLDPKRSLFIEVTNAEGSDKVYYDTVLWYVKLRNQRCGVEMSDEEAASVAQNRVNKVNPAILEEINSYLQSRGFGVKKITIPETAFTSYHDNQLETTLLGHVFGTFPGLKNPANENGVNCNNHEITSH